MSWLSNFFGKLFGSKKEHSQPQRPSQKKSPPTKKQQLKHTQTEIKREYPPHTLGGLLKRSPAPMPDMHSYDVNHPPSIAQDARDHLQARINQIPPMPEIWHKVQEILQQDDASAADLGQCVAQDPVLTAQIIKVCNSSVYAASGGNEISNIPLAIARLGLDEASSIIFRCLAPDLGGSAQRKMEIRHIWFHAQGIAILSRILAEPTHQVSRHEATLTGMLHDIGKLVILHIESDQQLDKLKKLIDQGIPSLAAEYQSFGYTHIDAGMMLALHWRLPKSVQQSISFHHHPAVMKVAHLPQGAQQHAMLVLHVAHLVLQHDFKPANKQQSAEQRGEHSSIWHSHQRTCLHDTLSYVQNEMSISLESESFYSQLDVEIERLKRSFPDLFESES
ncbi:HDOD domain-containing protein [Mariprofundus ferrooxydans]|nr:HDOD domain-containing protein [Mariprofundus ferrooxydans]